MKQLKRCILTCLYMGLVGDLGGERCFKSKLFFKESTSQVLDIYSLKMQKRGKSVGIKKCELHNTCSLPCVVRYS